MNEEWSGFEDDLRTLQLYASALISRDEARERLGYLDTEDIDASPHYKKLVINALLAGFWAGLAALQISGELTKAAVFAAGAVAVRAVFGYLAAAFGKPVPVDA